MLQTYWKWTSFPSQRNICAHRGLPRYLCFSECQAREIPELRTGLYFMGFGWRQRRVIKAWPQMDKLDQPGYLPCTAVHWLLQQGGSVENAMDRGLGELRRCL
jgi:hypothetical protein